VSLSTNFFPGLISSSPRVFRQRVGRALLQFVENLVADGLSVPPQAGIPKSERLDPQRLQKSLPFQIMLLLIRKTVLSTVQFNAQPRFLAKLETRLGPVISLKRRSRAHQTWELEAVEYVEPSSTMMASQS
jgi:hypothetical protein